MARLGQKITVFGLDFKTTADLCKTIGYSASLSKSFINQRYGTLENMVKTRLRIDDDEQAKAKLLELLGQKDEPKEQKAYIDDSPVVKCARAFVTACINKGLKDDKSLLDGLMMAFNINDIDAVKNEIERLKNEI